MPQNSDDFKFLASHYNCDDLAINDIYIFKYDTRPTWSVFVEGNCYLVQDPFLCDKKLHHWVAVFGCFKTFSKRRDPIS
jgi:hypothetical protein